MAGTRGVGSGRTAPDANKVVAAKLLPARAPAGGVSRGLPRPTPTAWSGETGTVEVVPPALRAVTVVVKAGAE